MSKMGNMVVGMDEDITWMDKEAFIKEYGGIGQRYWKEVYGDELVTADEERALAHMEYMEMITGRF